MIKCEWRKSFGASNWMGAAVVALAAWLSVGAEPAATPLDAKQRAAAAEQVVAALKKAMPAGWTCEVTMEDVTPGQWTPAGRGTQIVLEAPPAERARLVRLKARVVRGV